jgi:hypothetical protein
LIRRIAGEIDPGAVVNVKPVMRVRASLLIKQGELERQVERAARKLGGNGAIFILIDCEGGCPAHEGPALLERARNVRRDMPMSVVLAKKEYEAWFIAAAESLRGQRGLVDTLVGATNPEDIRGAKEWLSSHMPLNSPYAETTDQPAMTAIFDMQAAARHADSFDKCYREIVRLLKTLKARE